jgi:CYTH domain-containing protein
MGQEIERKYLVHAGKWQQAEKPEGALYRQGYILTDPEKTIRVRLTPAGGFLTIKGPTKGATRPEYEYEIPHNEAEELLEHFTVSALSKIRYRILHEGRLWEVDEFLGDNAGLIVAEIELDSEDEPFGLPDWAAAEVTGQEKYYNSRLTLAPFNTWTVSDPENE